MNIDLNDYDKQHAAYIEALTKKLESIYQSIIRQAVKYGLSVNFDSTKGAIFDFDKFPKLKKRMEELMVDMQSQILALVTNGITSEWGLSDEKNDYLVAEILASTSLPENEVKRYQIRNREALSAFQRRKVNGLGLSDRVWNLTKQFKTELELALDVGIGEGRSAQQISRDVRGYLNQPDKLFRRVRNKHGSLKLSKAAAAYHPGQGVYRSSYKNALRMARTEVNMAYRSADYERWNEEWFVIGIEIKLSNNHTCNGKPFVDICDYLKGKYPKSFKFTGWHPQCRCYAVPVLCSDEEFEAYLKARQEGQDISNWKFKGEVKEMPKAFTGWMKDNSERVARMKTKPYFITDNRKLVYPKRESKQNDAMLANISQLEENLGIKRGKAMTFEEANTGRENPNYKSGGIGYSVNCQTCTVTHELRRRGFDVEAKPNNNNSAYDYLDSKGVNWMQRFLNQDGSDVDYNFTWKWAKVKGYKQMTINRLIEYLNEQTQSEGRYEIYCAWKGGSAHVFCAERTEGVFKFFDPQSGKEGESVQRYISNMKANSVGVIRMDDKIINPAITGLFIKH